MPESPPSSSEDSLETRLPACSDVAAFARSLNIEFSLLKFLQETTDHCTSVPTKLPAIWSVRYGVYAMVVRCVYTVEPL